MRQLSRGSKLLLCAFAAAASFSANALAQSWPNSTVTVVVPWPPGGPSDIAARPVAKRLTEDLGHPFVIDNRGGGGGNIGSAAVARAPADGNTLLITSSAPIVINPSLYKKMTFDPSKDLVPITNLLRVPLVLVANPAVPANNLKELMAYIKAQKGQFSYASAGSGTPQHMTGELFKSVTKLEMTHVPYKGSAPAISDLLGGHIPVMFDSMIAIMPHIKSGKVKAIAVSGAHRSPQLPDVPTFAESGVPAVVSYAWYGFFAPAGTPKAIVNKINAETQKIMKEPAFQKILADTGSDYVGDTPENFAAFVKEESVKWAKVVKESGATVD
ncbi:ABC transporter substrate-binding protein [Herminiimonas sp. KBW02]|uniref:Tripartite tricarboxylate transporter substrate binding protein n=1 Tax=Herminiimonas contaminans TaxID=1111140 RepID=A0ABS0ESF0_9BURK|nr:MULTISPECIES: tripartite tricarboxylate transporter substrate binding protein [Oxalobacteraceae]MBF8177771.1 tripartite tricarboxylate transporter substrate binding protein [Herminiimonas contaminans]MBX9800978.1 tripartite tricarboxylate transporter substrate binding protein [Burkholderiaceae bacterium]RQO33550.1 ABC transporter substrate-binding protein [Herminiimonas sp. KBW02]